MEEIDKNKVIHFLAAIENGSETTADIYNIVNGFDPLVTYFSFRYLREKHPITENHSGPGERMLELFKTYPELGRLANTPKDEPMVEWFDDSHSVRAFYDTPEDYVDLIVDKLEG